MKCSLLNFRAYILVGAFTFSTGVLITVNINIKPVTQMVTDGQQHWKLKLQQKVSGVLISDVFVRLRHHHVQFSPYLASYCKTRVWDAKLPN